MGNIFSDITTAVKLTAEVRKARKEGATVEVRKTWTVCQRQPENADFRRNGMSFFAGQHAVGMQP